MKKLRFEKVGDISSKYPFVEVCFEKEREPLMEISITDDKELSFKIYGSKTTTEFTLQHWEEILKIAKDFLPKAIKDEEDFESFLK
ncbi:hypothetical protein [Mesonia oceanica]|uniref:Uncharacterized protein n=1 Tax=Mesonia oceanica TaxID=2687242 RepID=A0AC61Y3I8_9FLAO|nr:hypothetical protein [Mesonia oceanica]MAQ41498.1 hypothetical protein [Mesonia sp.]MBJ98499.1 hypothetical protein [Flavobacteriaceae bacterium]VVU99038.1 hypothetical protein FVB9532_00288 [Mesonia oceanica]|tara:strand:- start:167 stop:424 length:258 start_codon:yes stop_codon:yes gene_type:complete